MGENESKLQKEVAVKRVRRKESEFPQLNGNFSD